MEDQQHALTLFQLIGYLLGSGFLGSLITQIINKFIDNKKFQKERRLEILRTLMKNRGDESQLSKEYVDAINLINLEFYGKSEVINKWKVLHNIYHDKKYNNDLEAFSKDKNIALTKLIHSIIMTLGYNKIQQLDVLDNSYEPGGWANSSNSLREQQEKHVEFLKANKEFLEHQKTLNELISDVLNNKKILNVKLISDKTD